MCWGWCSITEAINNDKCIAENNFDDVVVVVVEDNDAEDGGLEGEP